MSKFLNMNIFPAAALLCAVAAPGLALAQKNLTLVDSDNESCQVVLQALSSLQIDASSGNVTAGIESLEPCIPPGSGSAAALFIPAPTTVEAGSSFTVVWASSSETGCSASSSRAVSGWSGTKAFQGFETRTAPSDPGFYTLFLDCDGAQAQATLEVLEPPPDPVVINWFRFDGANAVNITKAEGEQLVVSWSTSNATSCQATGTMPGWQGTSIPTNSSSTSVTITSGGSIGIQCDGPEGPVSRGPFTVTMTSGACASRAMPTNWNQKTTGTNSCIHNEVNEGSGIKTSADCRRIDGIWSEDWPMSSTTKVLTMGFGNQGREYVAIGFNSGPLSNFPAQGNASQIIVNEAQVSNIKPRQKIWTISTCPGDFNKAAIVEDPATGVGCYKRDQSTGNENFLWGRMADWESTTQVCGRQPNTDYYLNIIYSNSPDGTAPANLEPHPDCVGQRCGNRIAGN
jgi:hypothetical protein